MKALLVFAVIGIVNLAASGIAQDSKKPSAKPDLTKAIYMVPNQHCPAYATALEQSLKRTEGIKSTTVNFPNKLATVVFDENVISAQEISRAMFQAPHAMGANMKYGAFLLLSVPDARDKATGSKAVAALNKVEGVAKAMFYQQSKSVAIEFADKGKATSTELIKALEDAGVKGTLYGAKGKK
jgi:copper chaperone CopZ